LANGLDQVVVEGSCHEHGHRERRRRVELAGALVELCPRRVGHAVECLAPPVVRREANAAGALGLAGRCQSLQAPLFVSFLPSPFFGFAVESGVEFTHLTRFCSFSSFVRAATRAAARSGGDRVVSQTLIFARGPFLQSGYFWKAAFWATATVAAPRRMAGEYLMAAKRKIGRRSKCDTTPEN